MNLINEIYSSAHVDLEENQHSRDMERELQKLVRQFQQADPQEEWTLEEYFCKAGSIGQEYGFWSGVRFGVQLMAECLL